MGILKQLKLLFLKTYLIKEMNMGWKIFSFFSWGVLF